MCCLWWVVYRDRGFVCFGTGRLEQGARDETTKARCTAAQGRVVQSTSIRRGNAGLGMVMYQAGYTVSAHDRAGQRAPWSCGEILPDGVPGSL